MKFTHDAMRLLEEGGVSGLIRYEWNKELTKSMQAAYAAGAKDMQERCAMVCEKTNSIFAIPFEAVNLCIQKIKALET